MKTEEIWNITIKSIKIGYSHLQKETWKDMILKSEDVKEMKQLRNAILVIETCRNAK